ncbi:MAG: extracellular solute-binding protein [Clostridiales bacterium]|nr:extracellular solute-binding protein [Clostridiales bacterium]
MKKLTSLVLVLSMVLVSLAGCGGGGETIETTATQTTTAKATEADTTKEAEAEAVTLTWALWDWEATTYYEPLIDAYIAENPHVTIEYLDLGSADYQTMLSAQLSGGADDIDIITVKDIPGYSTMVNAGQLETLNDRISAAGIDTSAYGGTTEQITIDNSLYALPFRSDFWVMYYNKDLFDAADVAYPSNDMTFEEYDALARKMTSGEGIDKVYGAHYHTWRSAVQLFGILDGKNTIVDGSYDFLAPYYELILNQQKDGVVMDYATLKTSSTHYSGVFYNNQVAMMNMGSWFIATLISKIEAGETDVKNFGIVKYPHAEGIAPGTTLGTITSLAVNKKSANTDAAFDFLSFVCGEEGAEVIANTGTIPAIKNDEVLTAISGIEGFPSDDESKEALKTAKTYLEMPVHEKSSDIEVILNLNHDEIMTENTSIEDGIATMNTDVQELLSR